MDVNDSGAEEARAQLLLPRGDWSQDTLEVWLRAKGFCEYCGKDLQRSSDDFYHGYNIDHVMPASKEGHSNPENYALACRTCNLIKRDFLSPHEQTNASRDELIERAKEHIQRKRQQNEERMKADLRRLRACGL